MQQIAATHQRRRSNEGEISPNKRKEVKAMSIGFIECGNDAAVHNAVDKAVEKDKLL